MTFDEVIHRIEFELSPNRVEGHLVRSSIDSYIAAFQGIGKINQESWIAQAICVGKAYDHLPEDTKAPYKELGKAFGSGPAEMRRLCEIYQQIIKPRMETEGSGVDFFLEKRGYYETAVIAAKIIGLDAAKILEIAEDRVMSDPTYTVGKFKVEVFPEEIAIKKIANPEKMLKKFQSYLEDMYYIPEELVAEFILNNKDPQHWLRTTKRVSKLLDQIVAGLRTVPS